MKKLMLTFALVVAVISCDSAYGMWRRNINEKCDIFGDNREYTPTQINAMPGHWIGKVAQLTHGDPYHPSRVVTPDLGSVDSQSHEVVEPVMAVPNVPAVNPLFVPVVNYINRRHTNDERATDPNYTIVTTEQFKRNQQ